MRGNSVASNGHKSGRAEVDLGDDAGEVEEVEPTGQARTTEPG